jgi:drug/metabolite transporter (DMT)-like permease
MSAAMNRREWALLVTLTVLWSGSFLFAKVALADVGPITVVLARVGLAAAALLGLMTARGERLPASWEAWRAFAIMGFLNNALPQGLISYGMLHIESGLASILNATTPLFSVVLAHATGRERATAARVIGVGLGLIGVAVLVGPAALRGLTSGVIGQFCVLGAAASYACAGLYGRRLLRHSPVGASAGMLAAAAVLILPAALALEAPWKATPGVTTIVALLALALVSTAAGYVVYFLILRTAGPTYLLLVTLLMPIGAVLLGALVIAERPSPGAVAGMALIFVGLMVIDGRWTTRAAWTTAPRAPRASASHRQGPPGPERA